MANRYQNARFFWMILVILTISTIPTTSADLLDGLMAYYSFDNISHSNNNLADLTEQGRNGTIDGGLDIGRGGILGESFLYTNDVNKRVSISFANGVPFTSNPATEFSINLWVNMTDFTGENAIMGVANHDGQNNGYSLRTQNGLTSLVYLSYFGGVWPDVSHIGAGMLSNSNWVMVTLTRNATDLLWYKNGALLTSTSDSDGSAVGAFDLRLGQSGGVSPMDGKLDELGFWNRSLNTSEITSLYAGGSACSPYTVGDNFSVKGVKDAFYGSSITKFNISMINGTDSNFYQSDLETYETIIISNASSLFNITIIVGNYFNKTYIDHNVSSDLGVGNLTYNYARHNISAYVAPDNLTQIMNFTLITPLFVKNTTNGSLIAELTWNATTSGKITAEGYANRTFDFNGSILDKGRNVSIYTSNSFDIKFYDELTNILIDFRNISLELISDIYGNNYSTENGTMYIDLLTPADYILRYFDNEGDYFKRNYYITLTKDSYNVLNLYLLNSSNKDTRNVTATVLSTLNEELEGALITVQKYDISTNSYLVVEKPETNFEGEALLHLTDNEFYKFVIKYAGSTVLTTTPTYIYEDDITFIVDLGEDPTHEFYEYMGIEFNITFNKVVNSFSYWFDDSQNLLAQTCLRVYTKSQISGDTLYNSTCVTDHSGTIIINVAEVNGTTYEAKAYSTFANPGNEILMGNLYHAFYGDSGFGNMGLFLIFIMTAAFALVGFWNPVVALLLAPMPLLMGAMTGMINVSTAVVASVVVGFGILAMIIGRHS